MQKLCLGYFIFERPPFSDMISYDYEKGNDCVALDELIPNHYLISPTCKFSELKYHDTTGNEIWGFR